MYKINKSLFYYLLLYIAPHMFLNVEKNRLQVQIQILLLHMQLPKYKIPHFLWPVRISLMLTKVSWDL